MSGKSKGPGGPYINELLCWVVNHIDILDPTILIKACVETYKKKDIEKAKELVFNLLTDDNDLTSLKKRNNKAKTSDSKEIKDLYDIYLLLQEKGTKKWPQFVAADLSKLPPITLDSTDCAMLLKKIMQVQTEVDSMKLSLETQAEVSESLNDANILLQDKINKLETSKEDTETQTHPGIDKKGMCIDKETQLSYEMPFPCKECDFVCDHIVTCIRSDKDLSDSESDDESNYENNGLAVHPDLQKTSLKMFDCPECDFKFETNAGLNEHSKIHMSTDQKNVLCSECGELMNDINELNVHMQSHNKLISFSCTECDFKDQDRDSLKEHMRKHFGEKPQTVPELNSHMNTYNMLNMFTCLECEYQDQSKDKLIVHMRIHDRRKQDNVVCNVCKKCFESIPDLNLHMHTHNMFNLFSCAECGYQDASKDNLKEHRSDHFGEKVLD